MQFIIFTGPVVDGHDVELTLSNKHHRRLANILLDWHWSLPNEIRRRIEKIQAAPSTRPYPSIRVDVSLSGDYHRRGGSTVHDETRAWKSSFCYCFPYRPQYVTDNHYKPDCFDPVLTERLTERLLEDLEKEHEAARFLLQSLSGVLRPLKEPNPTVL